MGFDEARWVWMNGTIVPWSGATLHVSAHTLHYGSGVFEGIRCYETVEGPAIFRLREHLQRLFDSARFYDMEIPYTAEELEYGICELVQLNDFRDCYIRPLCYRGSHTLHLNPRACRVEVVIIAWPWDPFLNSGGEQKGVRICVSPWRKFDAQMMPSTAKACGQYINSILAVQDAERRGYDEALLLEADECIAEGAGENLFLVRGGRLVTNDARHSILLGITRDAIIEIANDMGIEVEIGALMLDDLLSADEAFFTGTAVEVAAIQEMEGKRIGSAVPGPMTQRIQEAFRAVTSGRSEKYKHWLHPVESQRLAALKKSAN
jgi:branched-chain amino acid aminotransferase